MPDRNEIDKLFKALRIEREIFLRVFHNPTPKILNPIKDDSIINLSRKRLKDANKKYQIALRRDDIIECAGCGDQGIGKEDELPGDDEVFEIFEIQTDSDSVLRGEYLCDECMSMNNRTLTILNQFITDHRRYPVPGER